MGLKKPEQPMASKGELTMTTLSRQEIEALDKLAEKATAGRLSIAIDHPINDGWSSVCSVERCCEVARCENYEDAEFLSSLRNAWPQLRDVALSALDGVRVPVRELETMRDNFLHVESVCSLPAHKIEFAWLKRQVEKIDAMLQSAKGVKA